MRDIRGGVHFERLLYPGTMLGIHGKEADTGFVLMGAHTQVHTLRCTHSGYPHSDAQIEMHSHGYPHLGADTQVSTLSFTHLNAHTQMPTVGCPHLDADTQLHTLGFHTQVPTLRGPHLGAHTSLCPGSSNGAMGEAA